MHSDFYHNIQKKSIILSCDKSLSCTSSARLMLHSYGPLIRPINALIWNPRAAGHDVSVCSAAEVPHSAGNTFMWSWLNLCSSLPSAGLEYDLGSEIHLGPHTHTHAQPLPRASVIDSLGLCGGIKGWAGQEGEVGLGAVSFINPSVYTRRSQAMRAFPSHKIPLQTPTIVPPGTRLWAHTLVWMNV